jgi:hypothetical protein
MQTISEKVDVVLANNIPLSMHWRNRDYKITKVGLRHTYLEGKTLIHTFSVLSDALFLKLKLNSKSLQWRLEEVYAEN